MAEVVGVVAAGVAFAEVAVKLGSHVFALKRMWNDIKDVPDTIKLLVEKIELLGLFIQDMEVDLTIPSPAGVALGSGIHACLVASCRSALDALTTSVDELSKEINSVKRIKRVVIKGKLVLKKDFWVSYEQRLQQVVWMLGLTQQQLAISLAKRQPELIVARLELSIKDAEARLSHTTKCSTPDNDSLNYHRQYHHQLSITSPSDTKERVLPTRHLGPSLFGYISVHSTRNAGATQYYLQFKPPSWLTQKAWSMITSNSYSGFKINLRTYNVVPSDAPVMEFAELGDTQSLLDLFDRKLASPFDISEDGDRLIDVAMFSADAQAIATMVDWGLDLAQCFDPLAPSGASFRRLLKDQNQERLNGIHRLALAKKVYEDNVDVWARPLRRTWLPCWLWLLYFWDPYALRLFLPHLWPEHYDLPVEQRLEFFHEGVCDPEKIRYLLWADGKVNPDDIQALDQLNIPLLRLIASRYRDDDCTKIHGFATWNRDWRSLAQDIIEFTSLLQSIQRPETSYELFHWDFAPGTALCAVIGGDAHLTGLKHNCTVRSGQWLRIHELALRHWLEDLGICGIDLNEYGRVEQEIFQEHDWIRSQRYYFHNTSPYPGDIYFTLTTFSYGPMPEDWKFVWHIEYGEMVAEFWDLIENPPLHMIGAWVDDD